jgi:hypothetical protein
MKLELIILGITAFFIANTYYDGTLIKTIYSWKKYYTMGIYIFLGLSVYLFMKKNPSESRSLLKYANNMVKYLPIDKEAMNLVSPILDFTSSSSDTNISPQEKRMIHSGNTSTHKRSVSETKKKYVASQQGWICGSCEKQLPAWFEVDHKIRLEYGGTNNIDNLIALCRDCHGKKTAMENL